MRRLTDIEDWPAKDFFEHIGNLSSGGQFEVYLDGDWHSMMLENLSSNYSPSENKHFINLCGTLIGSRDKTSVTTGLSFM